MRVMVRSPHQVVRAGLPVQALIGEGAGQPGHADGGDPRSGAGAAYHDVVTEGKGVGGGQGQNTGAGGGVLGYFNRSCERGVLEGSGFDEASPGEAFRYQNGPGCIYAAQHDAGGAQGKLAFDAIATGLQQKRAAEAVGLKRHRRDAIDRALEQGRCRPRRTGERLGRQARTEGMDRLRNRHRRSQCRLDSAAMRLPGRRGLRMIRG